MRILRQTLAVLMLMVVGVSGDATTTVVRLSLDECLEGAMESSQMRPVSRLAVEIAEAQHAQAMSSWWPRATLTSSLSLRDQDPLFVFPEENSDYAFGLLGQPTSVNVTVPAKRITLQDRVHMLNDVDLVMPLYTGGLRGGYIRQAEAGIAAAQQSARRTDQELTYDVTRYYHAAVLTQNLVEIGDEALARLEVTLELTENLYREGSGKVKKTDYLAAKVIVEGLRSVVEGLRGNRDLARAALTNTMGWSWQREVIPAATQVPFDSVDVHLPDLVEASYRFNPDWGRLQAGLDAAVAAVDVAGAGRMPKVALVGNVEYIANDHDAGIVSEEEKRSWLVALAVEVPLFDGFLTRHRLREARARLRQLEHHKTRLQEGLGTLVRATLLDVMRAQRQERASRAALDAATQNRSLHVRAYQDQLVEMQDVIQSQLTESFVHATYQKVRYDHAEARARLDRAIGTQVAALLIPGG